MHVLVEEAMLLLTIVVGLVVVVLGALIMKKVSVLLDNGAI
jgi:hypothetical protein